jgi:hypothetical protein
LSAHERRVAEKDEYIPIGPGQPPHLRRAGDLLHPEQQKRELNYLLIKKLTLIFLV